MSVKKLREQSEQELQTTLATVRAELLDMRWKVGMQKLSNVRKIRALRRQVAQIQTLLQEKKTPKTETLPTKQSS